MLGLSHTSDKDYEDLKDPCFSNLRQGIAAWVTTSGKRGFLCQGPPGYSGLTYDTATNSCRGMPANMEEPNIKTPSIPPGSALLDMLEGSVRQITMSVLPTLDKIGLYTRIESMAIPTPGSVSLDTKTGIVFWK